MSTEPEGREKEILIRELQVVWSLSYHTHKSIKHLMEQLQHHHDNTVDESIHMDDYKMGYVHGVLHCINQLEDALPALEERQSWAEDALSKLKNT